MLNRSASLAMSTSILRALPGQLDIKRRSPSILYLFYFRYTLSCKEDAIAVMLCSFFPKFPNHSNDNRYHLQAFRHMYVLAAQRRTVLPRDVDTGFPCYVPMEIRFKVKGHSRG